MKNNLIMSCIYLVVLIFSCSRKNGKSNSELNIDSLQHKYNLITYYDNGKIYELANVINGKYEGDFKEYYENGEINYINNYKNGLLDGNSLKFYSNGNIELDMFYKEDKPLGIQYTYFEKDSAKIKNKFIIGRNKNKEVKVSLIKYDSLGSIIFNESRVNTFIPKTIFKVGDTFDIRFELAHPEFDNYRIHIGNFDRALILVDSIDYKIYSGKGHTGTISLKANKIGKNYIRGYMDDYKIDTIYKDGSFSTTEALNNWFDIEYTVTE